MYDADPDVKQVVDVAHGLEGLRRQDGIHAAAVVITKEPLTDVPADPAQAGGRARHPEDAPVVTQYEMHGVEDLGLLKMDFLGLRNLDVITDTVEMVRATKDPDVRHRRRAARRRRRLRAARPGRHDRRVPARVAADAGAAALAGARPTSTTCPPSSRCTGRGRWASTCTTTTPTARTAASRSATSTPTPRRCWPTPTALMIYQESVMRVSQKLRRLLAGRRRQPAQGLRQEDPRADGQGAGQVRRRLRGHRLRPAARQRSCSTSSSASPTTRSTRATRSATASSPTRPPTSRPTTRSSTSPAC